MRCNFTQVKKDTGKYFYLRYIVILILLFRCIVKFVWREQYRSFNSVLLITHKKRKSTVY